MTTHIVAEKITPVLKHTLNSMQSRVIEGMKNSKGKGQLQSSFLGIHVVSLDWLKQCLMKEQKLPEDKFKPEICNQNGDNHQTVEIQRKKVIVRLNIFQGKTFKICHDGFNPSTNFEQMEKLVIENGGRVIDGEKAMFTIQEDGFDQSIWKKKSDDNAPVEDTRVVHFRYVQACVKEKKMLITDDALHLLPLPHKVPIADFKNVCLEMAMVGSPLELLVFSQLIKLYGFKHQFKE